MHVDIIFATCILLTFRIYSAVSSPSHLHFFISYFRAILIFFVMMSMPCKAAIRLAHLPFPKGLG